MVLGLLLWQGTTQAAAQAKATKAAAPAAVKTAPAPMKALGVKSAPITIEVFSDFQCPACKTLYEQTLRPLIDNYVSTGKVYLVHRDFPLEQTHKYARQAARYANAAGRLGKFERVVEALYAKQDQWSLDGNVEGVVAAALTQAEMKQVRVWVQQPAQLDAVIDQDVRLGNRVPVRSTPTVVVLHAGATYPLPPGGVNYSLLRQFLDDLLRR
jgi:protein-disulfide isomerase